MEVRVGGTGAGVLVGCGVGLGFLTPVQLSSIPMLGQLASSISSSIGSADSALGGLGQGARRRVRSLGVKGLDFGFGCGAMLGYGYGAGLMLTPSALQSLKDVAAQLKQRVMSRVPLELSGSSRQLVAAAAAVGHTPPVLQNPASPGPPTSLDPGQPMPVSTSSAQRQGQQQATEVADLMRLVLRQQNLLEDLQQQVAQLQAAVCKMDSSAPGCNGNK